MKNLVKVAAVIALTLLTVTSSFGQVTASASATATIVAPIGITKTTDMNFGNVAEGPLGGTVVLAPAGTRTIGSGDVTLPPTIGTVSAATFAVTGQGTYTYAITLPASCIITRQTGSETMTVDAFVSTPTVAAGGALTAGAQTLRVGATLNVGALQVPGTYVSGTSFDVTVNYN